MPRARAPKMLVRRMRQEAPVAAAGGVSAARRRRHATAATMWANSARARGAADKASSVGARATAPARRRSALFELLTSGLHDYRAAEAPRGRGLGVRGAHWRRSVAARARRTWPAAARRCSQRNSQSQSPQPAGVRTPSAPEAPPVVLQHKNRQNVSANCMRLCTFCLPQIHRNRNVPSWSN